jgi:hypothetical protein
MPLKDNFILGGSEDKTGNRNEYLSSRKANENYDRFAGPGVVDSLKGRQNKQNAFKSALDRIGADNVTLRNTIDWNNVKPMTFRLRRTNSNTQEFVEDSSLTLLINPNDLSVGATQAFDVQLARDGHVKSLWGQNQMTFTGSGKSPAFVNSREGLSATSIKSEGFDRTKTLGYANTLNLFAFFKNNGYQFLKKENSADLSSYNESSRVIHVLNDIQIDYDGNQYQGYFNTFTLSESASSPFNFDWNFDFVVSGISGDEYQGHLNDGIAENTGMILGVQGTDSKLVYNFNLNQKINIKDPWIPVRGREALEEYRRISNGGEVTSAVALKSEADVYTRYQSFVFNLNQGCAFFGDDRDLIEEFQIQLFDFYEECKKQGVILWANSGYRTKQDTEILIKNRKNGDTSVRVDPAEYGRSLHNYGLALDVQEWKDGELILSSTNPRQRSVIGATAVRLGMRWGGNFSKTDPVHVEFNWASVSPSRAGFLAAIRYNPKCNGVVDVDPSEKDNDGSDN